MQAAIEAVWQDARFGARILWRSPGITLLVILALALGIGVNSAMFSVVDALILHPLSFERPDELVLIYDRDAQGGLHGTSAGNFIDWRNAKSFTGVAAIAPNVYVMTGLDKPVQLQGSRVTANVFQVLGAKPVLGRTFLVGEDGLDGGASARKVAVISYSLWQGALGGDPNVLGRSIRLSDVPFDIIGVMPQNFELLNRRHQIWVPAVLNGDNREYRYLGVLARLKTPVEVASSEMQSISAGLAERFPANNRGWTTQIQDLRETLVNKQTRTRLLLLFGAVGLILLLACSNVASLLLARSAGRGREIALRVSLGATRSRIVRQLLVESLLLSLLGGALGLALAAGVIQVAPAFVPASAIPTTAPVELNALVIQFTFGLAVATGLLFGLAPAVVSSRPDVQEVLQDTTRGATGGRGRQVFRQAMVTVEVAVALMLLAGAAIMTRGIERLSAADLGLNKTNVLTQRILLPVARYDAAAAKRFYREALDRVAALPGVTAVAAGSLSPLSAPAMSVWFDREDSPVRPRAEMPETSYTSLSAGYFALHQIPILAGREFSSADVDGAPAVAIINAAMAARFFPNNDAVGQRIRLTTPVLGTNSFSDTTYVQIVGIAGNLTPGQIGSQPEPTMFVPMQQNLWSAVHWIAARTNGDPNGIAAAVRDNILAMDSNLALDPASTLEARFATQFAEPRFQTRLMGTFAFLALSLAVVGIYGLNAYAVSQQHREIGVRLALGATPGSVVLAVLRQGMILTSVGIAAGLLGATALSSILSSTFVGAGSIEWIPLLTAALILAAAAAFANWLPAWRVSRIDPAIALRSE
ncbi:MAG: ABC transporter permease [Acidobacteriota bacterium]